MSDYTLPALSWPFLPGLKAPEVDHVEAYGKQCAEATAAPLLIRIKELEAEVLVVRAEFGEFIDNTSSLAYYLKKLEAQIAQTKGRADAQHILNAVDHCVPILNDIARRLERPCPNVSDEVGRVAALLVMGLLKEDRKPI